MNGNSKFLIPQDISHSYRAFLPILRRNIKYYSREKGYIKKKKVQFQNPMQTNMNIEKFRNPMQTNMNIEKLKAQEEKLQRKQQKLLAHIRKHKGTGDEEANKAKKALDKLEEKQIKSTNPILKHVEDDNDKKRKYEHRIKRRLFIKNVKQFENERKRNDSSKIKDKNNATDAIKRPEYDIYRVNSNSPRLGGGTEYFYQRHPKTKSFIEISPEYLARKLREKRNKLRDSKKTKCQESDLRNLSKDPLIEILKPRPLINYSDFSSDRFVDPATIMNDSEHSARRQFVDRKRIKQLEDQIEDMQQDLSRLKSMNIPSEDHRRYDVLKKRLEELMKLLNELKTYQSEEELASKSTENEVLQSLHYFDRSEQAEKQKTVSKLPSEIERNSVKTSMALRQKTDSKIPSEIKSSFVKALMASRRKTDSKLNSETEKSSIKPVPIVVRQLTDSTFSEIERKPKKCSCRKDLICPLHYESEEKSIDQSIPIVKTEPIEEEQKSSAPIIVKSKSIEATFREKIVKSQSLPRDATRCNPCRNGLLRRQKVQVTEDDSFYKPTQQPQQQRKGEEKEFAKCNLCLPIGKPTESFYVQQGTGIPPLPSKHSAAVQVDLEPILSPEPSPPPPLLLSTLEKESQTSSCLLKPPLYIGSCDETSESNRCLFCSLTAQEILRRNLHDEILKLIENRHACRIALVVHLRPDHIYHVGMTLIRNGQSLGCLYATEECMIEACNENVFKEFLTFFVVSPSNTPEEKERLLSHTFEVYNDKHEDF